jgi:hypothetical protein
MENITGIQFIYVPSKDIKDEEVKVVGRYASATTVPNTRQHDCFISTGTNKIECTVCQVAQTTQKSAHQKLFPLN